MRPRRRVLRRRVRVRQRRGHRLCAAHLHHQRQHDPRRLTLPLGEPRSVCLGRLRLHASGRLPAPLCPTWQHCPGRHLLVRRRLCDGCVLASLRLCFSTLITQDQVSAPSATPRETGSASSQTPFRTTSAAQRILRAKAATVATWSSTAPSLSLVRASRPSRMRATGAKPRMTVPQVRPFLVLVRFHRETDHRWM